MKRKNLKKLLIKSYTVAGADLILRGERKPRYEIMVELNKKNKIPFDIWLDIKSYLQENDTKHSNKNTNTKK
jgi:hypothetical protein